MRARCQVIAPLFFSFFPFSCENEVIPPEVPLPREGGLWGWSIFRRPKPSPPSFFFFFFFSRKRGLFLPALSSLPDLFFRKGRPLAVSLFSFQGSKFHLTSISSSLNVRARSPPFFFLFRRDNAISGSRFPFFLFPPQAAVPHSVGFFLVGDRPFPPFF